MRELSSIELAHISGGRIMIPGACSTANLVAGAGIGAMGMGLPGLFSGGPIGGLAGAVFGGSLGMLGAAVNCGIELRAANR
ncbi:hypothetical protein [Luteibacter sp. UNCMF366Tsu5.1]|uniref:hypothetical protein n=1 Tax=Luteibacter sp. UNCMF366Tsu5.1 TaxID=1502758 RepID=UPI0009088176|nr:hypothetical protein [Luteibacter sp. UNCMF366Tsu5.1]SFW53864.1 hypothetical protein SAMN02800691_1997 [Luteibacter sp. UNCMF366Tsu5.1]